MSHRPLSVRRLVPAAMFLATPLSIGCAVAPPPASTEDGARAEYFQPATTATPARNHGFRAMSVEEFELLKKSVLFTDEDARYLRLSRSVLEPRVDELLDVWYGFVGSNEHLVYYFAHPETKTPDAAYLEQVRARFRDWVLTTADANFDQAWLDRQLELGLRHHRLKKNETDGVDAVDHIPLRYLIALHYPITTTLEPFLASGGHSEEEVAAMHEAWRKAVLMTVILWSQPYVESGDF
ncbi:MAG: protoglobin domain-containing protein [Phycisphaerales bacterium]